MNEKNIAFDFAIEEYRSLFELLKIHFDSIKNLFRLYLTILVIPFTVIALINKTTMLELKWTNLGDFLIGIIVFICISGIIIFRTCVEHRIKTIFYVRCINKIRKFFIDMDDTKTLNNYLLLSTDAKIPPIFSMGRDYFWEASLIVILNSALLCVIIINLISNWVWGIVALTASIFLHFLWYWKTSENRELFFNNK